MSITIYPENYYDDFNTPDANGLTPEDKNYLRISFAKKSTIKLILTTVKKYLTSKIKISSTHWRTNSG